jgi:hypothetical protein
MFHKWITADDGDRDECVQCGVVAPDENKNILGKREVESSHGCVPLTCPGPQTQNAHEFSLLRPWVAQEVYADPINERPMLIVSYGWTVACDLCGYVGNETLKPSEFRWECAA